MEETKSKIKLNQKTVKIKKSDSYKLGVHAVAPIIGSELCDKFNAGEVIEVTEEQYKLMIKYAKEIE